jgi:hypothetical protein
MKPAGEDWRMPMKIRWVIGILLLLPGLSAGAQDNWQSLFNGKNLEGWVQLNGSARYSAENGELVGKCVAGSPNSFLCTKEEFGDFIFECDTKIDWTLNSGIQFRSICKPEVKEGRVFGYQVEIDASERAWTGGIYDESRRGWLHTLDGQEASRSAFRDGEWNRLRLEAIGPSIRTWVNGIPCADIIDDETAKGFIGLQVHGIGMDSTKILKSVRWRNIRIMTRNLEKFRTPESAGIPQYSYLPNTLTEREQREGWKLLWDGKSPNGWRGAKLDRFPEAGWEMANGVLTVLELGGRESRAGGDIVTTEEYASFELLVDFKITRGANSGIKYFVNTELNRGEGSAIGCEFQILDDAVHEDATKGVNGNRKLAGLYDLLPPVNVRFNGIGEWNRAGIIVQGKHVEHWLNGFRTVEYERGTQMWRALVDHSKYVVWPGFGEAPRGHILLQDHGNRVSFRSIKIRTMQ